MITYLQESCSVQLSEWSDYSYYWGKFDTNWGDLTDEECQVIRDSFSIMKDEVGMLGVLDELSNKYLGTTGNSKDSWDSKQGCYTGGIFSGCRTSANHEIWERILEITKAFYCEQFSEESVPFSTIIWREWNHLYIEMKTEQINVGVGMKY